MIRTVPFVLDEETRSKSPNGCRAFFVDLGNNIGLKLFADEDERDHAMRMQEAVCGCGYAPKVYGEEDRIDEYDGSHLYGYLTEKVDVVLGDYYRWDVDNRRGPKLTENEVLAQIPEKHRDMVKSALPYLRDSSRCEVYGWAENKKLADELHREGFVFHDNHHENIGITSDGRLVPIDFGAESMIVYS